HLHPRVNWHRRAGSSTGKRRCRRRRGPPHAARSPPMLHGVRMIRIGYSSSFHSAPPLRCLPLFRRRASIASRPRLARPAPYVPRIASFLSFAWNGGNLFSRLPEEVRKQAALVSGLFRLESVLVGSVCL